MSANIILQTGGGKSFDTWRTIFGDSTPHQITYDDLEGITELRPYAFYGADGLSYVELPCTISKIGAYAFQTTSGTTLTLRYRGSAANWANISKDDKWAGEYPDNIVMVFDDDIIGDEHITYQANKSGNILASASHIIQPGTDLIVLRESYDGKTIYGIADQGFRLRNCSKTLVLPYGIEYIGPGAFNWCDNLRYINLPNTLTTLGDGCFSYSGLETIYIPSSVINIRSGVFSNCNRLTSATIDANTVLPEGLFEGCATLRDITLKTVSNLGAASSQTLFGHLFYSASGYDGMIDIEQYYSDFDLYATRIPEHLTNVNINGGVLYYGTFSNCTPIEYVTLSGVTAVADKVFLNCNKLKYLYISADVTSFGAYVFDRCNNLTSITYGGTRAEWGNITLDSNWLGGSSILYIECSDGVIQIA